MYGMSGRRPIGGGPRVRRRRRIGFVATTEREATQMVGEWEVLVALVEVVTMEAVVVTVEWRRRSGRAELVSTTPGLHVRDLWNSSRKSLASVVKHFFECRCIRHVQGLKCQFQQPTFALELPT